MARWRPLPDDLDPRQRELVVRLRELKSQAGISAGALARQTTYSRSSWDRYLNGKSLPPLAAVERLGRLCGAEPARLSALWELAARARGGHDAGAGPEAAPVIDPALAADRVLVTEAGPLADPGPLVSAGPVVDPRPGGDATAAAPAPWRHVRGVASVAAAVLLAAIGLAVWLSVGRSPAYRPSSTTRPTSYSCDYTISGGRLYAGHSSTSDRLVALNGGSQDVVEVQCLLKHHGLDPGRIDGMFGKHTEDAVKSLQGEDGAVTDGIVGPQTWALLRG